MISQAEEFAVKNDRNINGKNIRQRLPCDNLQNAVSDKTTEPLVTSFSQLNYLLFYSLETPPLPVKGCKV
jgi:hypothetical protein